MQDNRQPNEASRIWKPEGVSEEQRVRRAAYRWNTAAGILLAFQSVIMLMVLTRVCDVGTAGVFTIAYANANLFLTIGKYGMRQFQVSDRSNQFTFREYSASRAITLAAMLVTSTAYLTWSAYAIGYSLDKALVIFFMCIFKAVDSAEDIFHGDYQRRGRLDIASRVLTARIGSTIALFAIAIILSGQLLPALFVATIYTVVFLIGEIAYVRKRYKIPEITSTDINKRQLGALLKACFPLCAASFLLFYIGNAPKYAIDALMNDTAQAYYGYIAMPVFIVSLLAGFVYNPMITSLADQWRNGESGAFVLRFAKLAAVIVGITAVCALATLAAGVPVLNLLYNADLSPYLMDLVILVVGGGFLAITSLATLGITIIRFQRILIPIYIVAAIIAWAVSNMAVGNWGITGASCAYLGTMAALACFFVIAFVGGVKILKKQ